MDFELTIPADIKGIMESLEKTFGMSAEEIMLQTIYLRYPDLFKKLRGVKRLRIFLQHDMMTEEWIRKLTRENQIPHRHMLIRVLFGLKPQQEVET